MTDLSEFMDGALYDAEYGAGLAGMVAGALRLASDTAGPVLDLACGTGEVALALARAGHEVTGVDLSVPMLTHARTKAGAEGVTWLQADIRTFRTAERFRLILLTGNAVQAMLTDTDQEAVFANIRAHLAPGGIFAFDTRDPAAACPEDEPWEDWNTFAGPGGAAVRVAGEGRWNPATSVMTWRTRRTWPDGRARETRIACRFTPLPDLRARLEEQGLTVRDVWADWAGTPHVPGHHPGAVLRCGATTPGETGR